MTSGMFCSHLWSGLATVLGKSTSTSSSRTHLGLTKYSLAYAETKLILSRVLYRFNFELKEESVGWMAQKAYVLWEKPPMYVYVTPRSKAQ